jgi:signal transduction histidine kinase
MTAPTPSDRDVIPTDVIDRITDGVVALDTDLRYRYLNRQAERLLGVDASDVIGARAWECNSALATFIGQRHVETALSDQDEHSVEHHSPTLNTWFQIRIYPDEEGVTLYFADITSQRAGEESLRSMYRITADPDLPLDDKLQQLLDLGRDYLDLPYGFVTRISDDVQRIVQEVGDHPEIQRDDTCPLSKAYCRKTIEQEGLLTVQNAPAEGWLDDPAYKRSELDTYIGSRVLVEGELYGTFCFADADPRPRPFTEQERTFVELMTLWTRYELEQQHHRTQLKRQNEWLDEFASVLSHDLRNPLNVAQGQTIIAHDKTDPQSPARRHLRKVRKALDRMETIARDTLVLARREETVSETEPIDIASFATRCWEMVNTEEAFLDIQDAFTLYGDADRLTYVFENLFRNALDHGSDQVRVRVGQADDNTFYVEDDGPGIPADQRESIFTPGYSSSQDGSGLGLSIVKEIAEAHDWTVRTTEGTDGGARFEFTNVEIAD